VSDSNKNLVWWLWKFYLMLMVFTCVLTDDIRALNIESTIKADAEQISKAKAVVKKLRFAYTPYNFDNPKLQTHWRNIEALALDYNERIEAKDVTGNGFFPHFVLGVIFLGEKISFICMSFLL
jgi:hypothetical protein